MALTSGVVSQTFPNLFKAYEKVTGINLLTSLAENGKPFIIHRSTPHNKFILYNGSEIRFMGLDTQTTNQAATDKILSQEYLTACFEEGTEIDFEVIEQVKTRLAQKVKHFATGEDGTPKWITTLNPRTFDDWDYQYFHLHVNPAAKDKQPIKKPEQTKVIHFDLQDNIENVSSEYLETLESLSAAKRQRFLTGEHGDNFEGEVFQVLYWEELPPLYEFDKIIIYTDPSYKSGTKNDYKASMVIGRRQGAYWVINGVAMQCTTSQMILNVSYLYHWLKENEWEQAIYCWFENAGMPDDFVEAIQKHSEATGWVCPYKMDGRVKGDKYARIESALVPLNEQGKLFFNIGMKKERIGSLIAIQFLNFKKNMLPTEHDDIPDAVHGGVTLMNIETVRPGGISQHAQPHTKRNIG